MFFDKFIRGPGVLQYIIDGLDQIQLPAVGIAASLILAGLHPFHFGLLLRSLQNTQSMGQTDFIVGLTVSQQIIGALVELLSVYIADAVDHQMVVDVAGVHVGGDHNLEAWELPLGQLQPDGVSLCRCDGIVLCEGLDEVVELPSIGFSELLLSGEHLGVGGLGNTVVSDHQLSVAPERLLFLRHVVQRPTHRTAALPLAVDCREGCHHRTSRARRWTCSQRAA